MFFVINNIELLNHLLQYLEKLGKGEFGDVMLANYKGQKVAIKTMKDIQTRRTAQFLAEATVMT